MTVAESIGWREASTSGQPAIASGSTDALHAVDAVGAAQALTRDVFDDNLGLLDISGPTLRLVVDAALAGAVEYLADHTPVLAYGGHLLGVPVAAGAVEPSADGVTVVFGLGMGHTVRTLRDAGDGPLVVYEPHPGLLRSVLEFGPSDLGGIEVVCTLHELAQKWPWLSRGRAKAVLVRTPGYAEAFPEESRAVVDAVSQLVERVSVNATTFSIRAKEWIRNTLSNIGALCERAPFHALAGRYAGVPMFIVGAGPSLAKNGALLSIAAKKGIVIAVNSSARALAAYGVEPQVVACLETIDVSHLLVDVPYFDRVIRAFSLSAHSNSLAAGKGPLLPIYEGLPQISGPLEQLTGLPGLAVCGSVSTIAFSLAQRLGANPIVLVGQDLAYTGGNAYAAGTAYEHSRVKLSEDGSHLDLEWCDTLRKTHDAGGTAIHNREPLSLVPAWGGNGTEPAGPSFNFVRAWLEDAAQVLHRAAPELALVNATEGGARILGFQERSLSELLAGLPDRDITAASIAADSATIEPISRARVAAWANAQAGSTRDVGRAAGRVRRLAERAQNAAREGRPARVARAFDGLEKAEQLLREAVSRAPLVDAWASGAIEESLMHSVPPAVANSSSADAIEATVREMRVAKIIEECAGELDQALMAAAAEFKVNAL